jgi:flagellar hook-associated protein 1 FlgK
MGISSIMDIAKGALFAQQTALQVISNNVANVNTEGYMRQTAVLDESGSIQTAFGQLGNGVTVKKVMASYDKYLEASVAKENNATEEWKTYESYFGRIESVLNEDNTSLTANITNFFNAWQTLSVDPTSNTARTNVEMEGENVARSIRNIYSELESIQTEVNNNVKQTVTEINGILQSIAQVNEKIYESGSSDVSVVSQMTQFVKELSGIMDIQTFTDQNGGLTVMTSGGKILVDRGIVNELSAEKPATDDFYRVVWNGGSSTSVDITDGINGGSLKSLIDIRDKQIPAFMTTINDLAESLMTEVNDLHSTGYNANETTGIDFFKDLTQDFAANIDVSDEVKADVGNIAATSSVTSTSGNDIALALADLGSGSITIGGPIGGQDTTYTDYTASVASKIGALSQNAQGLSEYHQNLLTTVETQRDSVSGVTIDEEMTNLIKYQYAYQAAARLLNTADTLFSSLLEIGQ